MREQAQAAMRENDAFERIKANSALEKQQRERHRRSQCQGHGVVVSSLCGQQQQQQQQQQQRGRGLNSDGDESSRLLMCSELALDAHRDGYGCDMTDMDLGMLELKLGTGWQESQAVGVNVLAPADSKTSSSHDNGGSRAAAAATGPSRRAPSRGLLLAVVLVFLCVLPVLRGYMPLRWISSLALAV